MAAKNLIWKGLQLFLCFMCFALFLSAECAHKNNNNHNNGCGSWGPKEIYSFIALLFAITYSTLSLIMSCLSGNCCPCDWNQFDKVCCHGVAIAMTVASCYVSIFSGSGRNGDIWMACAFFFWFALAAYAFEIIIEHDLFGNCGFRGGSSGGGSSSNTNNNNSKKKEKKNKVNSSKA